MPYGLAVKMDITQQRFGVGCRDTLKLAEFIMPDLVYGIECIVALKKSALEPRCPDHLAYRDPSPLCSQSM